jgi:hypothetical protein
LRRARPWAEAFVAAAKLHRAGGRRAERASRRKRSSPALQILRGDQPLLGSIALAGAGGWSRAAAYAPERGPG